MNDLSPIATILVFIFALLASWSGVALFLRWSLSRNLLDVPNERSSHSIPTPRGGGLVIVIVTLLGYAAIAFAFGYPFSWGYLFGAIIIACVSWLDDLYSLPFWSRLIAHIAAAVLLVVDVGFWREVFVPLVSNNIGLGEVFGVVCTIGWIVWLVNAYNFMDGIDGIAALQAAIAGAAWAFFAFTFDLQGMFVFAGVLASVACGFLIHNWQPAKIFMGDVGSAFLGYTLAAMPLLAQIESKSKLPILPVAAVLFVWFFVLDTIVTFARRALGRKRVWEAHREHFYQGMVINGREHASVTLAYGIMSVSLSLLFVLALISAGIFTVLAVLSLVIPTFFLMYFGFRNKR